MSNGLILINDLKREEFNSLNLKTTDVSQFLAYYVLLLTTACQYGLISDIEAEEVSKLILGTFNEKFKLNSLIMSNNMYVLTLYLQSMNNAEQIEILAGLTKETVEKLFEKANIWFSNRINTLEEDVLRVYAKISKLKDETLVYSFKELTTILNECKSYSKIGTTCNFKKVHKSPIVLRYSFLPIKSLSSEKDNYLQALEVIVDAFVNEVSILNELDPVQIMENLKISSATDMNFLIKKNQSKSDAIEKRIQKLEIEFKEKLEEAKKVSNELDKKLEALEKADRAKFKEMHPELEPEVFEDAFEEWQLSLPDSHFEFYDTCYDIEDKIEKLEEEYNEKRTSLMEELEKLDKVTEAEFLEKQSEQNVDMSLDTVFKIFAIIEMNKINSEVHVPNNFEELSVALERLDLSLAIKIVDKTIKPNFSESEIRYLKKVII